MLFSASSFAAVTHLDNQETQALIEQGIPIIDVRMASEWQETGVIEGSHLVTFFDENGEYDLDSWLEQVNEISGKDKPFMLICAAGGRTGKISQFLDKKLEYNHVHNVKRGIRDWIKADLPVTPYTETTPPEKTAP